jgi:predicted nucleic acid-binding protein
VKLADALAGVRTVFLDTAPVIYHVENNPAYQPLTDLIFQQVDDGTLEAVTSSITLAECLVKPFERGDTVLVERFRNVITAAGHTRFIGVDSVAEQAAELRARYNLALLDALQIAAALGASCDAFLTNDKGLKRVATLNVLVRRPGAMTVSQGAPISNPGPHSLSNFPLKRACSCRGFSRSAKAGRRKHAERSMPTMPCPFAVDLP